MKEIKINNLRWLHFVTPQEKDIQELKKRFNIHPLILDELMKPSDRGRVERYDDYLFLVYHLPVYNIDERTSRRAEIDFIAVEKTLITVTYEPLEPMRQFERDLEKSHKKEIHTTAALIYYLIEEINVFSLRQLRHVERKVNFVGDQLFKKQDRRLLEEISRIKRDLLNFSLIATSQRNTLESLLSTAPTFWEEETRIFFSDLVGDFMKINYLLKNLRATIESYSETISQLFEFKTSEVIRRFSVLAFLTFPLILFVTIALQPTVEPTFIKNPSDFWMILGAVFVIVAVLAFVFRKRGWL